MIFRIRQISETADGREIVRVRDYDAALVSIGRASDCDLHLEDLAVEPLHAVAEAGGDGALSIRATGTLGFAVDGRVSHNAWIDPAKGAELGLGSHRITVSRDPDGATVLTIRRVEAISESAAEMGSDRNFSLSSALPAKRLMAWALFGCILLAFLLVPAFSNLMRAQGPKADVTMDASWTPGPLSAAHHALEKECTACHVKPFQSVRDGACLTCHKDSHDHAQAARLDQARATPGMGGQLLQTVAHSFGKPGPGACVDCHSEHDTAGRMEPVRQAFCADCHGALKDRLADSALGDASDFGTAHPQFRALVAMDKASKPHFARRSLDDKPVDVNGLSFSHDAHLSTGGTVARMAITLGTARGYGEALDCANCHRPTADGVRFLPVDMERDCEACHSLAYDNVGGTVRRLHHGDFAQMVADLRASQAGASANAGLGLSGRDRPGGKTGASLYAARFGSPTLANLPLMQAVSQTGVCGECHAIDRSSADVAAWQVQPVHQTARYFLNGWFDHKPHAQEKCSSCHSADTSTKASDLLLPNLADCRTCHMGENAAKAEVPSSCVMCHNYHPDDGAPWLTTRDGKTKHKTLFTAETVKGTRAARPGNGTGAGGTEGASP
jgi:predicted CXXCH cytochrome family protein